MLLYSLLWACRYLDCIWQMIIINHHQDGYDCGDKRNCWLWPELITVPNKRPTSDWEDSRDAANFWEMYSLFYTLTWAELMMDDCDLYLTYKISKCHHPINFSMNDKLAHWFADGKNVLDRVFALIATSARWLLRSQMYSTNTCVHVVWQCSIGCLSTCVQIYCQSLPAGRWPTNLWEKETLSMFRKYNIRLKAVGVLWMSCWLII